MNSSKNAELSANGSFKTNAFGNAIKAILDQFRFNRHFFIEFGVIYAIIIAITFGFFIYGDFIIKDPMPEELYQILVVAVSLGVSAVYMSVYSGMQFTTLFKLGVQFSIPRKTVFLTNASFLLILQLFIVLFTCVYTNGMLWLRSTVSIGGSALLFPLPAWAWFLIIFAPVAIGAFGGAILLRFGRKGFWVLYSIFMVLTLGPQFLPQSIARKLNFLERTIDYFALNFHEILEYAWGFCALAVIIPFAIAWIILRKIDVKV